MIRIIGIAGGSCSGKTTLARSLYRLLGEERCALLYQDSYYIDQSHKFREDGGDVNFDHPDALDWTLLAQHLAQLALGQSVEVPVYDFVTHSRSWRTEPLAAKPVILLDGTLILSQKIIRDQLTESVFISTSEAARFERRKNRDTRERGRELEGVVRQFMNHVKPMHDQFVDPSQAHASAVFSGEISQAEMIAQVLARLRIPEDPAPN